MTVSRLVRQSGFALLTKNTASQEEAETDSSGSRVLSCRRYTQGTKGRSEGHPGVAVSVVLVVGKILSFAQ